MGLRSFIVLGLLILSDLLHAQIVFPVLSPKGCITQMVGNTEIAIEYERPAVRGRKIFGEMVPYNELWRTGDGYCTKISFDQEVTVGKEHVPAGTYSLLTIPGEDEWVVILNKDTTLYGTYGYHSEKDVVRFIAKSNRTDRFYEAMTIDLDIIPNNARLYLSWENTRISFDIETTMDEMVMKAIRDSLMTGMSNDPNDYALAVEYLILHDKNLYDALFLAEKAIEIDEDTWARLLKLQIYEKLHLYDEALGIVNRSIEIVKKRKYSKEEYRNMDIHFWEQHRDRITSKQN